MNRRAFAALLAATALPSVARAQTRPRIRIGQATPAISFLPLMAARALGSFAAEGLDLEWAAIPGGDPTTLAALDSGDLDLAAVGSETVLAAIAKGLPFQIVASMMSKVSLELVVSPAFLKRTGVAPSDPLATRLAALKDAVVGVSAIGGTQDRAVRWLATQGGLNAKTGLQISNVGAPAALQAALENGRIEAFVLSPPEGLVAEDSGAGKVLIRIGDAFPQLRNVPSLVLVAKTPVANPALVASALRAMAAAAAQVTADPRAVGLAIHKALFARAKQGLIVAAVESLKDGVADGGRLREDGMAALIRFASETGGEPIRNLAAGMFWTNAYFDMPK